MRRRFWEDFFGRSWQKFCFDLTSSSKNLRRSCEIKADVLSRSSTKIFPESATHSLLRFREDSWKMIRKIWYDLGWFDDEIPNNLLRSYTRFDNLFLKILTHLYSLKKLKQSNALSRYWLMNLFVRYCVRIHNSHTKTKETRKCWSIYHQSTKSNLVKPIGQILGLS